MVIKFLTFAILSFALSIEVGATTEDCERALAESMALLNTEEGIIYLLDEEPYQPVAEEVDELNFLSELVMPKGLIENEANYQASRQRYLNELKPALERIRAWMSTMNPDLSFYEKLLRMGLRYDDTVSANEKRAILVAMLKMFGIKHENDFLKLISFGEVSMELKKALSYGIEKLIIKDPSWLAPLHRSMNAAGVPLK